MKMRRICILALFFVLLAVFESTQSVSASAACASRKNYTTTGYCITYPADGLCGPAYAGRSVWLANDTTLTGMHRQAMQALALLQKNAEAVTPACLASTQRWTCYTTFPNCVSVGGVAIPQLGCESDCEAYWDDCRSGFDLYLSVVM